MLGAACLDDFHQARHAYFRRDFNPVRFLYLSSSFENLEIIEVKNPEDKFSCISKSLGKHLHALAPEDIELWTFNLFDLHESVKVPVICRLHLREVHVYVLFEVGLHLVIPIIEVSF